jgi:hypothetical protein
MPGLRLTHEDRQHIAAGLADGLGYAEIARRLRRPTSTVSREVLRNGGPSGYRADRAHQATRRRARRIEGAPAGAHGREPDFLRAFEEEFAAMMTRTGLPRMPARVLVCLLTAGDGALSAAGLVHRLRVSPASVSKAVAVLEQIGLVRRERGARDRRERYVVDDDVWYRACSQVVQACGVWEASSRQGAELLGGTTAGARLAEMSRYFEHVGRDLAQAAEHWRRVLAAERPAEPAG